MKNPTMVEICNKQNGVTEMRVQNGTQWGIAFYTKDPDDALAYFAELIATVNGYVSLDTSSMRDLIVPRAAYLGNEEDEE